jgi:hypothetical protein
MKLAIKPIYAFLLINLVCSFVWAENTPESIFSGLKTCVRAINDKKSASKPAEVCSEKYFAKDLGVAERQMYLHIFARAQMTFLKQCPDAELKRAKARGDGNEVIRCLDFKINENDKGIFLALFIKDKASGLLLKALYDH